MSNSENTPFDFDRTDTSYLYQKFETGGEKTVQQFIQLLDLEKIDTARKLKINWYNSMGPKGPFSPAEHDIVEYRKNPIESDVSTGRIYEAAIPLKNYKPFLKSLSIDDFATWCDEKDKMHTKNSPIRLNILRKIAKDFKIDTSEIFENYVVEMLYRYATIGKQQKDEANKKLRVDFLAEINSHIKLNMTNMTPTEINDLFTKTYDELVE